MAYDEEPAARIRDHATGEPGLTDVERWADLGLSYARTLPPK